MLEKIVTLGYKAEMRGDFQGKTGTRVENGRIVFIDPTYRAYKAALSELALRLGA